MVSQKERESPRVIFIVSVLLLVIIMFWIPVQASVVFCSFGYIHSCFILEFLICLVLFCLIKIFTRVNLLFRNLYIYIFIVFKPPYSRKVFFFSFFRFRTKLGISPQLRLGIFMPGAPCAKGRSQSLFYLFFCRFLRSRSTPFVCWVLLFFIIFSFCKKYFFGS